MRCILAALALLALAMTPAWGKGPVPYEITGYEVEIVLEPDGAMVVLETIDVLFTRPRHGITRVVSLRGPGGDRQVQVLSIRSGREGSLRTHRSDREGGLLRLHIGDPQRTESGPQTYVLRYAVRGAVSFGGKRDGLTWDAVGRHWPVPVPAAIVTVRLPSGLQLETTRTRAHAGLADHPAEAQVRSSAADGALRFETTAPLLAGQGLTVGVDWPADGPIQRPDLVARLGHRLWAAWPLIPLIGWPLVLLAWWARRRERHGPEDGAPEAPASVLERGVLARGRLEGSDVAAATLDLAAREYLTITQRPTAFAPGPAFEAREALEPAERTLLESLLRHPDRPTGLSEHDCRFYVTFELLRTQVRSALFGRGALRSPRPHVTTLWTQGLLWLTVVCATALAVGHASLWTSYATAFAAVALLLGACRLTRRVPVPPPEGALPLLALFTMLPLSVLGVVLAAETGTGLLLPVAMPASGLAWAFVAWLHAARPEGAWAGPDTRLPEAPTVAPEQRELAVAMAATFTSVPRSVRLSSGPDSGFWGWVDATGNGW